MSARRTGKSFRAILQALLTASGGQSVEVITNHRHEPERLFGIAAEYCRMSGVPIEVDARKKIIVLPNGRFVRFAHIKDGAHFEETKLIQDITR
jgi:hypothetical protein